MSPKSLTVLLYKTATFICRAGVEASWLFNGGPLPFNAEIKMMWEMHHNLLTLNNVMLENSGTYTCYVEEVKHIIIEDDAELIVRGKYFKSHNYIDSVCYSISLKQVCVFNYIIVLVTLLQFH